MRALVVDGYNVIHKIPHLKRMADKDLRKARYEITRIANEYKHKRGGIDKVYVVFDGKDSFRNSGFSTPENQVFSRSGKGDEELIRLVSRLYNNYTVEVVTDDNYIINNTRVYKANVMSVSKFMNLLDKKMTKDEKERKSEKTIPRNHLGINEYLKKTWNIHED